MHACNIFCIQSRAAGKCRKCCSVRSQSFLFVRHLWTCCIFDFFFNVTAGRASCTILQVSKESWESKTQTGRMDEFCRCHVETGANSVWHDGRTKAGCRTFPSKAPEFAWKCRFAHFPICLSQLLHLQRDRTECRGGRIEAGCIYQLLQNCRTQSSAFCDCPIIYCIYSLQNLRGSSCILLYINCLE